MIKIQTAKDTFSYNPELPIYAQFKDAICITIDSDSDLVDEFLEKLQKANYFQILNPFDINVIPHNTLKSLQLKRKIEAIMKEMRISWISKTIVLGQIKIENKLDHLQQTLNNCLAS